MAGCIGNDGSGGNGDGNGGGNGDTGDDGNGSGEEEPVDSAFTVSINTVPTDIQYNVYNATGEASAEVEAVVFDPLVKNDRVNDEWIPVIVDDWEIDGDTLDLELSEEHTWHNGDPVTADDLATQFRIDLELGQPTADFLSSVEVTGDHSLRATLESDTINTDLLFLTVLDRRLTVKADMYGEYLEAIQDAEGDEERESAQSELLEWAIEEPVGNGPFKFDDADSNRVLAVKHEDHPDADGINFPEYEFRFTSGNQERWQGLLNDVTDGEGQLGITEEVLAQMPDHVELIRPPEADGVSLVFQHEDTVFSDPRVRKAVTYVLEGEVLSGDSTLNYQFQELAMNTGMMPTQAENYLTEELRSSLTNYNVDQEEAESRATELLQEAGFSNEGGTWMTPEGDTFNLPLKTIGAWWSIQAQSITAQLQEFGIEAEFVSQDLGTFYGDLGDGNYVMAIDGFSGQHPVQTFSTVFDSSESGMGVPEEIEVPMPVGDASGSAETVNVRDLIDQVRNTRDEEEVRGLVEELSWIYNQSLPRVPHLIGTGMTFMTNDDWEYPAADEPSMQIFYPPYWLLRTGELQAKTS
ncbi:ABC transporter substrate-binding protein [Halomontanus rarus]|uniref:ABC transporter substrate-binding protein n=1 Tax=Halomontanus rarus TaxID=3034020 RepID=UPI001A980AD6